VRTDETIDSKKAVPGQTFAAEVAKDVVDSAGDVVIPRGSNAQIVIRSSSKGGRITGDTRELVIPGTPFIVPYRLVGNTIQILRIFHGARRWPAAF